MDKALQLSRLPYSAAEKLYVLCFRNFEEDPAADEAGRPQEVENPQPEYYCIAEVAHDHDIAQSTQKFLELYEVLRPAVIVSINCNPPVLFGLPYSVRCRWLNYRSLSEWHGQFAEHCAIHAIVNRGEDENNPLISIVTTCFRSKDRINRVWESLLAQSYKNWEWILWDDNPPESDDSKYLQLKVKNIFKARHPMVHYFPGGQHSGFIGETKKRAFGVANGRWLLEMDHDDELHPSALQWIVEAGQAYPDAGFLYTDAHQADEDGFKERWYGEMYALGYGADYRFLHRGVSHYAIQTPPVNEKTLSHIVGVPNHVRVWRRDAYHQAGGHNPGLSVADDYDLILRTFCVTRFARITEPAYVQYMNRGGDNFTFHRNALIQYLVAQVHAQCKPQLQKRLAELQCILPASQQTTPKSVQLPEPEAHQPNDFYSLTYTHPRFEHLYVPQDRDPSNPLLSIVMPTYDRPDDLRRAITSVLDQTYTNWVLYIIGDACPTLNRFMLAEAPKFVPQKTLETKVRWFNLWKNHGSGGAVPRNYALKSLVVSNWCCYLDDDNVWTPAHLQNFRDAIANPGQPADLAYIFSSFVVDNKVVLCDSPVRGRIDTSAVCHRTSLLRKYGLWQDRQQAGYAHDWEFVSRWRHEQCYATRQPTLIYNTTYNHQSHESIAALGGSPQQ